jgi:hypothetical protein
LDGQKDTITGKIDLLYSLCSLLGKCRDLEKEETALQFLGTQLGVTVLLTPKFHAELAGEGVKQLGTFESTLPTHATVSETRTRQFQTAGERLHLSCEQMY